MPGRRLALFRTTAAREDSHSRVSSGSRTKVGAAGVAEMGAAADDTTDSALYSRTQSRSMLALSSLASAPAAVKVHGWLSISITQT